VASPEVRTPLQRLRQAFFTGLVIVLPLTITVWILGILVRQLEGLSSPILLAVLRVADPDLAADAAFATWVVPVVGVALTFLLVVLVGALAGNFAGRRLLAAFERIILRVPVVKGIYGAARQLIDAFSRKDEVFRRVVAVEYPRPGIWTIGFLTQSGAMVARSDGPPLQDVSLVFLPTSPNPTSGWLAVVPDRQVVPLEMSIEEGVKLIVSGGLVVPRSPSTPA
jgi:uncharacterized membrane protein